MTVLFGSIEYFQSEIISFINGNGVNEIEEDKLSILLNRLQNEIFSDFICEENIRSECMRNLSIAFERLLHKQDICVGRLSRSN
ncbi:hypothetical protein ACFSCX_07670 [Bacillus salitolerans]|uniref:Uncharacterized protein n=1 Tax=Bacillus salitolerans TaxID=1437434 RepID=A0ABW4LMP4_9BACI